MYNVDVRTLRIKEHMQQVIYSQNHILVKKEFLYLFWEGKLDSTTSKKYEFKKTMYLSVCRLQFFGPVLNKTFIN